MGDDDQEDLITGSSDRLERLIVSLATYELITRRRSGEIERHAVTGRHLQSCSPSVSPFLSVPDESPPSGIWCHKHHDSCLATRDSCLLTQDTKAIAGKVSQGH